MVCWLAPAKSRIERPGRSSRDEQNCSRPWLCRVSNFPGAESELTLVIANACRHRGSIGCRRVGHDDLRFGLELGNLARRLGPDDVDIALEIRAVLDHDAGGLDIADELGVLAYIELVGGFDVSMNGAEHDDFARFHAGENLAVGADGEAMLLELDGAFHFAVDGQILAAENLSFDDNGLAERGLTSMRIEVRLGDGASWERRHRNSLLGKLGRSRRGRSRLGCVMLFFLTAVPHGSASLPRKNIKIAAARPGGYATVHLYYYGATAASTVTARSASA